MIDSNNIEHKAVKKLCYQSQLKQSLLWAEKQSINVIPLLFKYKRPVGKWKHYRDQLSTSLERQAWFLTTGLPRNIGCLGGAISKNLCIFDIDNEALANALYPHFPPTTTVLTSHNKRHYYYRTSELVKSQRLEFVPQKLEVPKTIPEPDLYRKEIETSIIGVDIKAEGAYVVAPPSIHPSGAQYKFISNNNITTIDFNWAMAQIYLTIIKLNLKEYIPPKSSSQRTNKTRKNNKKSSSSSNGSIQRLINLLPSLEDMVGFEGNGTHPIHGSSTKSNLYINAEEQVWHCFRHNSGGGKLEWFMVREGLISCSEAIKGQIDNYGEALSIIKRLHNRSLLWKLKRKE